MPITDQVATAPCTDPIQVPRTVLNLFQVQSLTLSILIYFTRTNGMSRIREAPTCMPLTFPFLSRVNQTTYPCTSKWSLYNRLHRQTRCRTLFNERLVSVDGDSECRSSLFAKPIAFK